MYILHSAGSILGEKDFLLLKLRSEVPCYGSGVVIEHFY